MQSAKFSAMTPKEFRAILRSQTIVTVDENAVSGKFDIDSLLEIQSFSTVFDIEGTSSISDSIPAVFAHCYRWPIF